MQVRIRAKNAYPRPNSRTLSFANWNNIKRYNDLTVKTQLQCILKFFHPRKATPRKALQESLSK
jgi:hypothetical protein